MAFDFGSGFGDMDLSELVAGSEAQAPLPDNSFGYPAMDTSDPTGTGSGFFLSSGAQTALFGSLDKVLNYALMRDQYQMTRTPIPVQTAQIQMQSQQSQSNNFLLWAGLGLAAFLVITR